jgi:Domain of unknown function (DUF4926)
MIKELDEVALTIDLPDYHLAAGDVGIVVDITSDGQQVTLEFFAFDGHTIAVVPMPMTSIRPIIGSREIASARLID